MRRSLDVLGCMYVKTKYPKEQIKPKIKLVAIAKDEAAYLTDWIFHHLYFDFDQLVIYINNTSDNSDEIVKSLKSLSSVKFKDGDPYFDDRQRSPQMAIYQRELSLSRWEGYSHVMFLDIDEFYTPSDFQLSIKGFVSQMWADVCCLEWIHRMDENSPFLEPFQSKLVGRRAQQVKSIVSTSILPTNANPHNMLSSKCRYQLADGTEYKVSLDNFSRVPVIELRKEVKQAFILHRMIRSEMEYIAALKRGRPMSGDKQGSIFKNNRSGIFDNSKNQNINLPKDLIKHYLSQKRLFISKYKLEEKIKKGKELVLERYISVLNMIRTAPKSENTTLQKILKNVELLDVEEAYKEYLKHNSSEKL
ncbi:glycosyltransferase family 2 protein [Aliiglaciecola sp. 3_MG-2023]|uniref:glycosyltransferase family 2 protein n=1 Tax=Aliiglaciecola sp. 3_MG-2023 TaxID=3062644 RepID=UPI0026E3FF5A|nr:glycosyltransferase family 2 protein [Aliiglaciecola sp. 3_MG-2023]MDO6691916.1 glycosyltransferase family 2 protein [Aliiglaciecola sp. 3_MG-2023]